MTDMSQPTGRPSIVEIEYAIDRTLRVAVVYYADEAGREVAKRVIRPEDLRSDPVAAAALEALEYALRVRVDAPAAPRGAPSVPTVEPEAVTEAATETPAPTPRRPWWRLW